MYLQVDQGDYELWKLAPIAAMLSRGAVGVVPTDTVYAFVCDIGSKRSIERLYAIKDMDPKKPLSIMCRDLSMVSEYTRALPNQAFRAIRRSLPGPYTFIVHASTRVPRIMLRKRRTIGIRIPADAICAELLGELDQPLLCSSVRTEDDSFWNNPAQIADRYGKRLDFVVDGGARLAEPSTVIDMTGRDPEIIRVGKGDVELF